jgi:prevent-host-death family protein
MSRASVTDLKARLSHYLRQVRRGGEVEILDHGVPVARLIRVEGGGRGHDEERRKRLVRAGAVRQGNGRLLEAVQRPPLALEVSLSEALAEDRADRI